MMKVLVVDDEDYVRKGVVAKTDWTALDCVVVSEAEDGVAGVRAAQQYEPDLIISGICMPRMNGIEMLRSLREDGCRAAVIFLTACREFSYVQSAVRLRASDYLLKPVEDAELESAVKRIKAGLEREQEEREPEQAKEISLTASQDGGASRYVAEAVAYITRHYGDADIRVGAIAESLGISEGHLSHVFKKETQSTVAAYITRCRMNAAARLLSNCRYKVYEVAEMVGYHDIAYFSSSFKRIIGASPSEYQGQIIVKTLAKY